MSMFNTGDILETIEMFTQDNLDVRTVTMGISLLDCIDPDPKKACENIYNKITTKAANLVSTVEHISAEMNMTYYAENHYAHAAWCKQEDPKKCRDVDPRISNDVDLQMQYTLKVLNTIQTPHDILSYRCERELVHPIRPCLWYEAGDIQGTWHVLENVKCPTSYYFQGDVPPEKLKRDYWRVWKPMTAFVA